MAFGFLCFEPVRTGKLWMEIVDGVWVLLEGRVYPQLQAVPMGVTWALALLQASHLRFLDRSLFDRPGRRAVDFKPTPGVRQHTSNVDTVAVAGQTQIE